jgi:hypothetical protein
VVIAAAAASAAVVAQPVITPTAATARALLAGAGNLAELEALAVTTRRDAEAGLRLAEWLDAVTLLAAYQAGQPIAILATTRGADWRTIRNRIREAAQAFGVTLRAPSRGGRGAARTREQRQLVLSSFWHVLGGRQ